MSSTEKCPRCGSAMPGTAPEGLCPRCLLLAAAVPTAAAESSTRPEPPPIEAVQSAFPHLEIAELIGQGGMGLVYKARQPKLNRYIALKLLPQTAGMDSAFSARFAREAQALAALNHPNIITVHDYGESGGFFFLVMEFVDGVTLRQALQGGHLAPEQALAIVPQICEALQFAHDRGIVHRDIKPENLLLDRHGRLKIADFGIATILHQNSPPEDEAPAGTPMYAAPEQVTEPFKADHRADIYSLGVVFYEMLTGQIPQRPLEPPSRKVEIDVRLDEVVLRALEQSPSMRWQTANELRTRVETIASTRPDTDTALPGLIEATRAQKWLRVLALCTPSTLCAWFLLIGHRLWGADLDADEQMWASLVGFPLSAGLGALLAWLSGAFHSRFHSWRAGRWTAAPLLALLLLAASILLMGGGMVMIHLISQDGSFNPGRSELIFSVVFAIGGPLLALGATAAGWLALRKIKAQPDVHRGWRAGWVSAWFWPGFAIGMVVLYLPSQLAWNSWGRPIGREISAARQAELQREQVQRAMLNSFPPVVVRTEPASGARDVAAGVQEIRVTFSKPMMNRSWSWVEAWSDSTAGIVEDPQYESPRTCVLKVQLEPGRTYGWWINSENFQNFKDGFGNSAVPYLLIFETSRGNQTEN